MSGNPTWDDDYLLGEMPTREETLPEVEFLIEALELTAEDRVLDAPCGAGRHAQILAEKGIRVVGADLSMPLLQAARSHPNAPRYVRADLRALPFSNAFDAALCLFASFGLLGERGDRQALRSIAQTLAPNGVALIETWNPYAAAQLLDRRNWWRAGANLYLAEARFDPERGAALDARIVLPADGEPRRWTRETRFYTAPELRAMAENAGLRPMRWFGDFDGSPYAADSPRLIAAFEKTDLS